MSGSLRSRKFCLGEAGLPTATVFAFLLEKSRDMAVSTSARQALSFSGRQPKKNSEEISTINNTRAP